MRGLVLFWTTWIRFLFPRVRQTEDPHHLNVNISTLANFASRRHSVEGFHCAPTVPPELASELGPYKLVDARVSLATSILISSLTILLKKIQLVSDNTSSKKIRTPNKIRACIRARGTPRDGPLPRSPGVPRPGQPRRRAWGKGSPTHHEGCIRAGRCCIRPVRPVAVRGARRRAGQPRGVPVGGDLALRADGRRAVPAVRTPGRGAAQPDLGAGGTLAGLRRTRPAVERDESGRRVRRRGREHRFVLADDAKPRPA